MNDVICIIGMHRSGTSMVARLLNLCGLNLGPEQQLVGPDGGNPEGHFEHFGFVKIDEAILSHFGGSGAFPPPMNVGWELEPAIEGLVSEARLLVEGFRRRSHWGWKDPRTTLLLPFWKKVIPRLRYIICVRSPLEVAHSLELRDGMPLSQGAFLWNTYMRAAIRDTEGCPRIFTFYEDFFHKPLFEIEKLVDFCGLKLPSNQSVVFDAISQELRHNVSRSIDLLKEEAILPEYKLFYLGLRSLSLEQLPLAEKDAIISEGFNHTKNLIEELHSQQKLTQLQTLVAEKELLLKHAIEEKKALKLCLDNVEGSLTWQLSKRLERFMQSTLPKGTFGRRFYDRLLSTLKQMTRSGRVS